MPRKHPFPLTFHIQGAKWKVKLCKSVKDEEGHECRGLTDVSKRLIQIEAGLPESETEWVFWHEYCHALLHEASVVGNDGGLDLIVEEIICDHFANAMTRDKTIKWKRRRKKVSK